MNASSFPNDMNCLSQPVYRYRKDGRPGREIKITFVGGEVSGNAQIEVAFNKQTEITNLNFQADGDSVCNVLLPANIGVENEAKVTLTLIQDNRKLKKTVMVPPMRHWNVYLYNHSHVDIGYTNTQKNVEILHKTNIIEGIKLAKATKGYPEGSRYRWNPEVTWPLERLWQSMPDERENVLQAIRDGQLCVDASYLNLNTSVCSDEELFHAFKFSRKMQKLTGKPMDVFQQMDIPGMSWGLVPVLAQEGVRYIMSWPNKTRSGHTHEGISQLPFWWVGPDGKSKVLFLQPDGYANSGSMTKGATTGRPWFGQRDLSKIPAVIKTGNANVNFTGKLMEMEKAKYPYDFWVLSWTLWDNCPLDADIPDAVKAWNEEYAFPHIIISGGHEIMEMIEKKYGNQLPEVKGDFTEYWTDGLGTAAGLSALNRNAKEKLAQAETIWTMLNPGKSVPRDEFDEAWRYISLSSEHTWCFENPSEPYFQDAIWKVKQSYFHQASDRTQVLFDEVLAPVTDKSKGALGSPEGAAEGGVAVFNTHSWNQGGLIILSKAESLRGDRVTDEQEKDVPAQRLSTGELVFMCSDVPALGSRHFRVVSGKSPNSEGCKISNTTLENEQLRVAIDPKSGNITKLINLATGHNFADVNVNGGLNAFRWLRANVDNPKADSSIVITTIESGPLVVELCVSSKAVGCRSVSRSVRLVQGQPWVEITNVVDKLPLIEKDGVHFGFGFNIPKGKTRVDIPWGVMEMEKDQLPQANRNWIAMQRWLDISNEKEGVTWCSLDAPLFEYGNMTANLDTKWGNEGNWISKLEPSSAIYSWVMNNHWITNFPLTQDGPVTFRYRILPHGEYNVVTANQFGMEQSQPLVHVTANVNPKTKPLVAIDNEKVYVTILKSLGEGKETLVRLRSLSDKPENVKLTFPAGAPESIRYCTFNEEPGEPVTGAITMIPYGLATFRLQFY
ncbi:MAG: glycosyl hydrolase [Draconibacterium sp.]|nr:glycosyl hydrolase [Draconibacterium sp.]